MTARAWLIALIAIFAQGPDPSAQRSVFSARVDAVRVDVLVTEHGRPVGGLEAHDFEVFDNGVPQHVELATLEQVPLNVILALDMSRSVAGDRLEHLRRAGHALLDGLTADDRAALVTFGHAVTIRVGLTSTSASVRTALDRAEPYGDTSLVDAVAAGLSLAESDTGRALLVVFSDDVDTLSWLPAGTVAQTAARSDAVVYGVRVRGSRRDDFLGDVSDATGGDVFEAESTRELPALFRRVLDEFRHRYLVSYSPQGVARGGWHRLDVRVRRQGVRIRARPGYLSGS
jgi:VWFA-related protein